ncbi:hypothetical protein QQF64_028951 [Cirrhinus molitorella]|uniref:Uncharacterized protein n=1 Tax=Cirrhinus molitorella TaxID=172907 RepID=A0ABR3N808_9TELE
MLTLQPLNYFLRSRCKTTKPLMYVNLKEIISPGSFSDLSSFIRKDGCIPFPPVLRSVPSVSSQTSLRLLLPLDVSYWKNVGA